MPRNLSAAARQAIYSAQTGEVFVFLLTVFAPELAEPIRVCSDSKDLVSRGQTYLRYPFTITIPGESEDAVPMAQLEIANVDRALVRSIRLTNGPISVTLEVVLASTPDVVEAGPFDFTLRQPEYTAETITAKLMYEDLLSAQFPFDEFTPANYPGLR